uniref:Uncharacterized protein n=1 Tax=Arundo donax TaxID=35708 RepID=A0A0A9ALX3_ARUDO
MVSLLTCKTHEHLVLIMDFSLGGTSN